MQNFKTDYKLLHSNTSSFYQLHHLPTAKTTSNLAKAFDTKQHNG